MTLSEIRDSEILHVLHETYELWSAGLSRPDYLDYNQFQRSHNWGRRHMKFLALKHGGEIAAGCKSYEIEVLSRGMIYKFFGIGAMYSRKKFRGQGFGDRFLDDYVKYAQSEKAAGVLLFSDIGPAFYERHGFQELSSIDFSMDLKLAQWQGEATDYEVEPLGPDHVDYLDRYHGRWLCSRPYGVTRDAQYWQYKIAKENFLHLNSNLSWPRLQLLKLKDENQSKGGYCIYEVGGSAMRALEIVGGSGGAEKIWSALLTQAATLQIRKLRGWEGNLREISPGFNLKSFLGGENFQADFNGQINYSERDWGRAMMLPLDIEVEDWFENFPCPLMELDHL